MQDHDQYRLFLHLAETLSFTRTAADWHISPATLSRTVQRLEAADTADVDELQAALYGLYALISVHFAKEEEIQMAAFDAAPEATERVLRRVAAAGGHAHAH